MIQRFISLLNEPFPDSENLNSLSINLLGVGIFVTFFLYLLQPFGMHAYPGNAFWPCLGFGLVTFVVGFLYELLFLKVFKIRRDLPSWTLKKWILSTLFLILMVAAGNYLFINIFFGWHFLGWDNFLIMFYNTILVGIFPITFAGLMIQMKALKTNQSNADSIQAQLERARPSHRPIQITAQNQKQSLELLIDEFFFAESMQNYIAIHYLMDGKLQKQLLRNTIADVEKQLQQSPIIRCHRSYLINCNLVEQVKGNAQGLRVQLKDYAEEIPVSRKYIKAFRQKLADPKS